MRWVPTLSLSVVLACVVVPLQSLAVEPSVPARAVRQAAAASDPLHRDFADVTKSKALPVPDESSQIGNVRLFSSPIASDAGVAGVWAGKTASSNCVLVESEAVAAERTASCGPAGGSTGEVTYAARFAGQGLGTRPLRARAVTLPMVELSYAGYAGVYDGLAHAPAAVSATQGATVSYSTDGGETWSATPPSVRRAGVIEVTARGECEGFEPVLVSASLTVTPRPLGLEWTGTTLTYSGMPQAPTATVSGVIPRDEVSMLVEGYATDAGSHTASVRLVGADAGNYALPATASVGFVIERAATLTVCALGFAGSYDGAAHQVLATPSVTAGTTLWYATEDPDAAGFDAAGGWSALAPARTHAGETRVWVRAENPNYLDARTTATLAVARAEATVKAENATKAHGADDPELTAAVTGVVGVDALVFELVRESGEEPGGYVITPVGDELQGNYHVNFETGRLSITQGSGMVVNATGWAGVFDGRLHAVTAAASVVGAEISYSTEDPASDDFVDDSWREVAPSLRDVGSLGVWVRATHEGLDAAFDHVTLEVRPRVASVVARSEAKTYGASDPALTAVVAGLVEGDDFELSYSLSRESGEGVGSYAVVATGSELQGNYRVRFGSGTLTIAKARPEVGPVVARGAVTDAQSASDVAIERAGQGVAGKLSLDDVPLVAGVGAYGWTFLPADSANYEAVTGELELEVGHAWMATEYAWGEDCASCSAVRGCAGCGATEDEEGAVSAEVTTAATCEESGETTYTARFENPAFEAQRKTLADISAIGHAWGEPTYAWSADNARCTATRTCGNDAHHLESETARVAAAVTLEPTEDAEGARTHTAEFGNVAFATQQRTSVIPRLEPLSLEVTIEGWTFGDEARAPQVTGAVGGVAFEYKPRGAADDAYDERVPTHAGDYTLRATAAAAGGHAAVMATTDFSIARAAIAPVASVVGWTYGHRAGEPTVSGNLGAAAVSYEWRQAAAEPAAFAGVVAQMPVGEWRAWSAGAPTQAGRYELRATVAASADHLGATSEPVTFEVTPARVTVTAEDRASGYGAPLAQLGYRLGPGGVVPGDELTLVATTSATPESEVGRYDITVGWAGEPNPNYALTFVGGTYTITEGTIEVSAAGWQGVYDGSPHGVVVTSPTPGAVVWYSATAELTAENCEEVGSTVVPTRTAAGTTTVRYCVVAPNYGATTGTREISVAKAPLELAVSIEGWVAGSYDVSANAPRVGGNSGGGALSFAYKAEGSPDSFYSADVPIAAGSYLVRVSADETDNFEAGEATARFEVGEAPGTVTNVTAREGTPELADFADAGQLAAVVGVRAGERVELWLEASDEVGKAERAAAAQGGAGWSLLLVLDVSLYRRDDKGSGAVHQLGAPVAVRMGLSQLPPAVGAGMTRTWSAIRVHEGVASVLPASYDAAGNALTFSSDRFSTFAAAYRDTPVHGGQTPGTDAEQTPGSGGQQTPGGAESTPAAAPVLAPTTAARTMRASVPTATPTTLARTDDPNAGRASVALLAAALTLMAAGLSLRRRLP